MDGVTLHRESIAVAQGVVDRIDRAQLGLPTPCTQWNVAQVLEHMIAGNRRIAGDVPGDGEDVIGSDISRAYAQSAAASLASFSAPDAMRRRFPLSIGEAPGSFAVIVRSTDQLAHAWDLAKACGMSTDLAPPLYETALGLLRERFAEHGRNTKTYAPEQPVSSRATAADRFAAFAGRSA
jgi:uncharacterized protein (TIGR03086 family)